MNWFTCNYMNLVVNVLHMLLTLSPSAWTALPNIRHTFHLNLAITTITLVSDWSVGVVHVIFLCMMWLLHSSGLIHRICACPLCCVFLAKLGLIPFNLELTFTSFPFRGVGTSYTPSMTHCISHTLAADRVILLASMQHRGQGITLRSTAWTLHQTV